MRPLFALAMITVSISVLANAADVSEDTAQPVKMRLYGNAEVKKIEQIADGFCFICDITDWPEIIGENITIRIDGVAPPQIVRQTGQPNKFYDKQLRDYLAAILSAAAKKDIRLKNIRRGDTFALIAEVLVDGKSLSEMLIEQGLAEKAVITSIILMPANPEPSDKAKKQSTNTQTQNADQLLFYVASKSSNKYHLSTCRFAKSMDEDKKIVFASKEEAQASGRQPCKTCNP